MQSLSFNHILNLAVLSRIQTKRPNENVTDFNWERASQFDIFV